MIHLWPVFKHLRNQQEVVDTEQSAKIELDDEIFTGFNKKKKDLSLI